MKKIYLLSALMLFVSTLFGQNNYPITDWQLPVSNFEDWTNEMIPAHWYTFSSIDCTIDGCDLAVANGVFQNHHNRVAGKVGYGCQLYSVKKYGYVINGAMTTGKTMLQNIHPSDPSNYVFTQRGSVCSWPFQGRPDSIVIWAKFSFMQNTYNKASVRVHLHGDVDYQDMQAATISTPQVGKIANVLCELTNPATTPNANGVYQSGWTRFAYKFNYWDENNNPIATPTLQNTIQPSYALASLSTNAVLCVGENDTVTFDEIYCIYDKGLSSVKINGEENDAIRNYFNASEYTYHEYPLPNANPTPNTTYHVWDTICYKDANDLPIVSATPRSSLVISCTVTQPTITNPRAYINVMHNDSSTFTYILRYWHLQQADVVSLDHANNTYSGCEGETITVTASGASSYVWPGGTTGSVFHPTASGNYTVTATDAHGCESTAIAYVAVNPLPIVTINGNSGNSSSTICSGKTVNLLGGGAQSYHWSTGENGASIVVSTSGTYNVTATSSAGCTGTASHTLVAHDNPNVSISGPASLCSNSTDILTASGASTYIWSNGNTGSTLNINSGGDYSVTGTNEYGCTATAYKSVESKQSPVVSISGPNLVCAGSSITLTASSNIANTTYLWSNGSTQSSITVSQAGIYSVTATLNGCSDIATHTVTSGTTPAIPTVTPGSNCGSGSVTLLASSSEGASCLWFATNSTPYISYTGNSYTTPELSVSTTYYVCTQNSSGCRSARVPVTATINTPPNPPTTNNLSVCGTSNVTLTATPNSAHWYSDVNGNTEITATQTVSATSTYYAAVIDGNNCRSSLVPLTVTVNQTPAPPTVTSPSPYCSNGSVNVTLTATPASGCTLKWYNGDGGLEAQGIQTKSFSTSTTLYAKSYNNYTQCESAGTPFVITINPIPAAPTASCEPRCGAGEVTLTGNANGLTLKWYDNNDVHLGDGTTFSTNINSTTDFKASKP